MAKAIIGVAYLAMVTVIAVVTKDSTGILCATVFGGIFAVAIVAAIE